MARSLELGLLSNAFAREVRAWARSPLAPYFEAACFSCDIGHEMPDPQAYAEALSRLGVPARAAVFVGDGGSNELAGAKAAGFGLVVFMRGFLARNGLRTPSQVKSLEDVADCIIDNLEELLDLLQEHPTRHLIPYDRS